MPAMPVPTIAADVILSDYLYARFWQPVTGGQQISCLNSLISI
jgi:hypothetical protein